MLLIILARIARYFWILSIEVLVVVDEAEEAASHALLSSELIMLFDFDGFLYIQDISSFFDCGYGSSSSSLFSMQRKNSAESYKELNIH